MMQGRLKLDPFAVSSPFGDRRTSRHKALEKWMIESAKLRRRFFLEMEDDPFHYNETATVSFLTGSAYAAGGVALAEYYAVKRRKDRLIENSRGRDDLYVAFGELDWICEFKQIWTPTPSVLKNTFVDAQRCARQTKTDDKSPGTAVIVARIWEKHSEKLKIKYRENIDNFIYFNRNYIESSFYFSNSSGEVDLFIIFSDAHKERQKPIPIR